MKAIEGNTYNYNILLQDLYHLFMFTTLPYMINYDCVHTPENSSLLCQDAKLKLAR